MTTKRAKPLDAVDVRLLELLQQDADRPAHAVARILGISGSSVQRRIAALQRSGVIERTVALVRPERVGRPLFLIVQVWLEREDVRSVTDFKAQMRLAPEVVQCYHVTGDHTFVIVVCLPNMDEFAAFAERVFGGKTSVRRFCTSAVISRVKTGGPLPVSEG